ncbi:cytoskeletal protein RodZ [Pseudoclavibacter sp. JAI123]|uniref:hypothetical protein n=1 Tax=Pseudoclavibacter sp. JAI123 TaxID=2723065 RepID=UPI0015C78A90|nr:hypothetical protein [Pseudoclavibacter sp. JAI123]NYF11966.1 cytoskeletal protein RodZ [Pseudoclavibacter sp. JAI123]
MTQPKRRAVLKPFELLGISAVMAGFVLLILLLTTQDFVLALVFAGVAFIAAILVIAMLVLSYSPNPDAEIYLDRFENAEQGVSRSDEGEESRAAKRAADEAERSEPVVADSEAPEPAATAEPTATAEPVAEQNPTPTTGAPASAPAADAEEAPLDETTSGEAPSSK